MYRKFCICLLSFSILIMIFACCAEKKPKPLHILIDIGYIETGFFDEFDQKNIERETLITNMVQAGKQRGVEVPKDFEVEFLPKEGVEREVALDRIRTEIMSGGGPDLFIVACNEKDPVFSEEALFTMPEKAMELSIFLSLDEYMENSTVFAEWDKMNQTVLAAGRTDEGQQIIPMCYTFPLTVYSAENADHTASKEITWMDMLESEDEALRAATVWTDNTAHLGAGSPFYLARQPMTEFILGGIADYAEEELLFTEEEFEQRMYEIVELASEYRSGGFADAPPRYLAFAGYEFSSPASIVIGADGKSIDILNGIKYTDAQTMIPLYSDDGGVTAEITAYTAINRNSDQPEEAFCVLDYLMSYQAQKNDRLYADMLYLFGDTQSVPMYDELMSTEQKVYRANPIVDGSDFAWYLTDENFAKLCGVREQITHVKFRNELDKEFVQAYRDYSNAIAYGKNAKAIAAESYKKIQRMVRE